MRSGDPAAAWVAAQQLSLVTTPQLTAAGLGRSAITRRRKRGTLHRVHQGVYLFGQPTFLPGAVELAAVLACGDTARVSHRSCLALCGVIVPADGPVDVTVVGFGGRRAKRGIRIHRVAALHPSERSMHRGIPIVSPARALLEFAPDAGGDELERAIAEAYVRKLTTETELRSVIARNPHRAGVGVLRAELAREGGPAWTRREGERRMKLLVRQARLPVPVCNRMVAGYPADFLWIPERLIVEVDGFQFHGHRRAFERDRTRDAVHVLAGYRVIRVTWRQLTQEPMAVVATIAAALSANRSAG